jgi:hypothetical protein
VLQDGSLQEGVSGARPCTSEQPVGADPPGLVEQFGPHVLPEASGASQPYLDDLWCGLG